MKKNYNEILYKNQTIQCKDILLRKFEESDAKDILKYASDEEALRYIDWGGSKTIEEIKANIYDVYWARPGVWAIADKDSNKVLGCIDIRIVETHRKASFGFILNRDHWGKGYMTQALSAVLKVAFEELELNRVEAVHFVGNEGSGRVMEKCGMEKEGVLIQNEYIKGKYVDHVVYGIIKSKYEAAISNFKNGVC